jgi:hypothetical protein
MKFSKVVVLLATLSQALAPFANADIYKDKPEVKAFICKNYPNDPICKDDTSKTSAKTDAAKKAAEAQAAADAQAIAANKLKMAQEAAAAKKAAKEAADQEAAAEAQAEAKAEAAAAAADKTSDDQKPEITATPIETTAGPILTPISTPASETPQRAEGQTADGLKWKVHFNFPVCDHSDQGFPKGAYCEGSDSSASEKANGVEEQLISWIKDPTTKGLYLSYFSFSNKNIAAALCVETSLRPELKVTLFLDKGESQVGTFANNLVTLDQDISTPGNRRYVEGYKTGCADRLKPRETARGSGSFGGDGNYLQHTKIFMALDQAELPANANQLNAWIKNSNRIRFTSSSANMSSFGTTLHFENWIFFDAPANNYVAQQNLCTMVGFKAATNATNQRQQFKDAYNACEQQIQSQPMKNVKYYIVPSTANNNGKGPGNALIGLINSAYESVKVSIHRFTTSSLASPMIRKAKQGVPVKVIQDDDTLRKGVVNGGAAADVGGDDVAIMRRNIDGGVDITFMETNADTTVHMFHSKYVIADESRLFQGAGNFTGTSMNLNGRDGNYEHFYVITIPQLAKAYSNAWDYLRTLSTPRKQHPVGNNEYLCTFTSPQGQRQTISCDDPKAEDSHLNVN